MLMSRSGCTEIAAETGGIGVAGSVLEDGDIDREVATSTEAHGRLDAVVYGAGRHSDVMRGFELPPLPPPTRDSIGLDPDYARGIFDIPWPAWHAD